MKELLLLLSTFAILNSLYAQETEEITELEIAIPPPEEEEPEVFQIVEKMPEFPGGNEALIKFVSENIQYPDSAKIKKLEDDVYVQFIVDEQGKVGNPKIIRGEYDIFKQEALRVVSIMPDFTPGTQRGKPVKVFFTLPFRFKLP